jgi:hypothetical protein
VACSTKPFNSQTVEHHNPENVMTVVPVPQISHRKYTWLKLQIGTCHHYTSISKSTGPTDRRDYGMLSLLNLHILQAHIKDLAQIQNLECVTLSEKLCLSAVTIWYVDNPEHTTHATSMPNKATCLAWWLVSILIIGKRQWKVAGNPVNRKAYCTIMTMNT